MAAGDNRSSMDVEQSVKSVPSVTSERSSVQNVSELGFGVSCNFLGAGCVSHRLTLAFFILITGSLPSKDVQVSCMTRLFGVRRLKIDLLQR